VHAVRALAVLIVVAAAWAVCPSSRAERLPLTSYTTADGLGSDRIRRIVPDSLGFLWICHRRGVSRFDGQQFVSYGVEHGLPEHGLYDFLETRDGRYLAATAEGVLRFDPRAGKTPFVDADPGGRVRGAVFALLEDPGGILWAVKRDGLYRLDPDGEAIHPTRVLPVPGDDARPGPRFNGAAVAAGDGSLWLASGNGLLRRAPGGEIVRFGREHGLPWDDVRSLIEDREDRIWAGTTQGLARFDPAPERGAEAGRWTPVPAIGSVYVFSLAQTGDGAIWYGSGGLGTLSPDDLGAESLRHYTTANGLTHDQVTTLAEDRAGNLWIGTEAGGLMRLARGGLTSWLEPEGLVDPRISSIFETGRGELCATAKSIVYRLDGGRFRMIRPNLPVATEGWGWHQWTLQDHLGDWWLPTPEGLFRFSRIARPEDLATASPVAVYTRRQGLPNDAIFRLFEDSRGDIWIGTLEGKPDYQLSRWERGTGSIQRYVEADGIPIHAPTCFVEDGAGGMWIGFYAGGVARYRNGEFRRFTKEHGCPASLIRTIHLDRSGRLWIGSESEGAFRVDDPGAANPEFVPYTTEQGLSSNLVSAITEDAFGRLYLGTDRGIDRLDPTTGSIRRYTAADGLPNGFVNTAFRDGSGALWFGTLRGIARLAPHPEQPGPLPEVRITGVTIAGSAYPVSALGEVEVADANVPASRNRIGIEFGAVAFDLAQTSRYQYRLGGGGDDWGEPSESRRVEYANLAPGSYRFEVRTVGPDGTPGNPSASFPFTVTPPFWQRGWFLGAIALAVAAAALGIHRFRVARAVELERVRTRIATDLHDDIGASLSRIAILTESLQRRVGPNSSTVTAPLGRVAGLSRELVDSMSDIVWAINPKRDHWSDIVYRMRRFAADAFTGSEIEFDFEASDVERSIRLGPEIRREFYLVFKECVNNVVRHSGCTRAKVDIAIEGGTLAMTVRDDGRGFDASERFEGQGLASMRRRVESLGGRFELKTAPGGGTTVRAKVPIGRKTRMPT
jgi:signal transduction histidine kinase/ligand-binding sensor domain-containing protein